MGSIIDLTQFDMNNVPEVAPVNPGEYQLRIVNVVEKEDKNGNPYIMPFFEVLDNDAADEFGHYLPLPTAGISGKKLMNCKRDIVQFCTAIGINADQIDTDELKGMTCWALLGMGEYNGKPVNVIERFVTGH